MVTDVVTGHVQFIKDDPLGSLKRLLIIAEKKQGSPPNPGEILEMEIVGDGFVKKDIHQVVLPEGTNDELFTLFREVIFYSESFKKELHVEGQETPEEKQKIIAIVVFVRLLDVVQSGFILACHGVNEELKSLFRIFLDSYFVMANCCKNPDFISTYFLSDEPARLKLMNSTAKHKNELFKQVNQYGTEEIKSELDERVKGEKIEAFNSFLYAKNVNCEEIYDSLYRLMSASVHTTPRCLDHYITVDSKGVILTVNHLPDPEGINRSVYDFIYFFIKAIGGISELFGIDNNSKLKNYSQRLEKTGDILNQN